MALLLAVSFSPAATQGATTHYVSEGESIQDAITGAAPGDTIVIGPGEYSVGQLFVNKALTLQGSGAEDTVLYGSIILTSLPVADGQVPPHEYNTISAITIDNIGQSGAAVRIATGSTTPAQDMDGGPYYLSNVLVTDCIIWSVEGIYLGCVERAEVRTTQLYGFEISKEVPPEGVLDGDVLAECGIHTDMCGTVSISSNCLMGFFGTGIWTENCSAVRIVNNIVFGCDRYGISADGTSVMATNNTLVSNNSAIGVRSVTAAVANNITYPPFVLLQPGQR